ncbi:unnamed protein product, partial [Brenthis ino]
MLYRISYKQFILLLTIARTTAINIELLQNNVSNTAPLMKCFSLVSENHHNSFKSAITIYENNNVSEDAADGLLNALLENEKPFIKISDKHTLQRLIKAYDGTMLIVSYYQTCDELFLHIDLEIFDIHFRYLIIIDALPDEVCFRTLNKVLHSIRHYDITFLTKDRSEHMFKLEKFILDIDEETCNFAEIIPIETINVCHYGSLQGKKITDVFRIKIPTNFKKCNFNVGMATLFPYSTLENKELYKDLDDVDNQCYGADVELMKIFTDIFNLTLKLYYIYREEESPYLHKEFLEYLHNRTLDACAGGLYRIYGNSVAYSGIYSGQAVIWVYTVEREVKSWQALVKKTTGLYIFFIFYICYAILWKLMCKFDNQICLIRDTLFYGWGALVGASGLQDAPSLKLKILNVFYLILCIHLSSYISTQIYYYLTIEGPPESYNTFEELSGSSKTPYLRFTAKYFIRDHKYEVFVNTSGDCEGFVDCQNMILKHKGSTIIIDGHLPSLQSSTAVNDEARVLRVSENIVFIYHEMLMRKDHILVPQFNVIATTLFEAGIFQKLYVEAIGITVVDKARIVNKNILSNSYSCIVGCQITLRELAGAFYIWIIGCILSCCIFVAEIVLNTKKPILQE